jgi:tetratricopeptide (TPR) repeat protein
MIMRRLWAALFVVALSSPWLCAAMPPQLRGPIPAEFIVTLDRALKDYGSGNDQAVEALFRTREGIMSTPALGAVFGRPAEWTRMRAAFLAEVAVAAPPSNPGKVAAIELGRTLALSRPLPGANTADDRVEVLVHQIALAVYQDMKVYRPQLEYLDAIAARFAEAARQGARLDTRFSLAHAIAAEGVCCPPPNDRNRFESRELRPAHPTFEEATALFDRAAADPQLAAEARVRGAGLYLTMGRAADAIAWVDRVGPEPADKLLRYQLAVIRARALDLLDRPEPAAAAYEAARLEYPTVQTPAIGRAAALLRIGQTAEAVRVATAARRLPPDAPDPRSEFVRADGRFLTRWLDELRTLRK